MTGHRNTTRKRVGRFLQSVFFRGRVVEPQQRKIEGADELTIELDWDAQLSFSEFPTAVIQETSFSQTCDLVDTDADDCANTDANNCADTDASSCGGGSEASSCGGSEASSCSGSEYGSSANTDDADNSADTDASSCADTDASSYAGSDYGSCSEIGAVDTVTMAPVAIEPRPQAVAPTTPLAMPTVPKFGDFKGSQSAVEAYRQACLAYFVLLRAYVPPSLPPSQAPFLPPSLLPSLTHTLTHLLLHSLPPSPSLPPPLLIISLLDQSHVLFVRNGLPLWAGAVVFLKALTEH